MDSSSDRLRLGIELDCAATVVATPTVANIANDNLIGCEAWSIGRLSSTGRRPSQTIRNRPPFTGFRHGFHHDQLRARLVATMQFRVNRPSERLRIVRDDRDETKTPGRRDVRVRDDVTSARGQVLSVKL